jgi:flagellar biosynthesis protein FlhF
VEYFIEQALTYTECLNKIRMKYGERATILYHKNIRMGGIFGGLFAKEGVEITGFTSGNVIKPGSLQTSVPPASGGPEALGPKRPLDFDKEKEKILAAVGKRESRSEPSSNSTLTTVLGELRDIKRDLKEKLEVKQNEHSNLSRIRDILETNDFLPSYIQNVLERAKKEFSLDALNDYKGVQDKVLEWIGESIHPYKDEKPWKLPRIMALVGPTGVGKTTTIAKLAAIFGIGSQGRPKVSVRMITVDAFKIGALAQIEKYGDIMQIPVSYADKYDELKKTIAMYSEDVDLILVDTFGRSPRDAVKLAELKQLLEACGSRAEIHLAVAASTKGSDLLDILRQFEPFGYRSVIITKLDESTRIGNVISVLAEKGKTVSYITDGQGVPNNIQTATVVQFLINLEGFQVNRAKVEARFPVGAGEQVQWR